MHSNRDVEPDSTAVRVALWRAMHVQVDPPPHVFEDEIGLKLTAPPDGWRSRPDMSPFTRPFRASILARARFIEDLVAEQAACGVRQYVILGAGLDTFAQRRQDLTSSLLAEVRHEKVEGAANSLRINSGNRRVYTTFAVEFEALGKGEIELMQQRFLLCRGFGNAAQTNLAAVSRWQNNGGALQSGE